MEGALHIVTQYGYAGIFILLMLGIVGLPVPDEWLLLFSGFLVSRGDLRLLPALLAAFAGSACGISLSYALGRTLGLPALRRYGPRFHLGERELQRVEAWYARLGKWSLVGGYFAPGVRHFTAMLSGTARLGWPTFARFAYPGAFLWTATFLCIGYQVGEDWRAVGGRLQAHYTLILGVASALLVGYLLLRRWRRGGRER